MVLQQHQEVFDRSIILPPTSELTKIQIPVSGGGKAIRWNTAGTALELFDLVVGTVLQVITTEGDLIQGGTAGAPERLGIGAVGCLLHRVGAKWAALALGLRTRY